MTIIFFNHFYAGFAERLTTWENHRTENEHKDAMVLKLFVFQFVNSYFSLYLSAFVKPFSVASHPAGSFTYANGTAATAAAVESNWNYDYFGVCTCKTYAPANCYNPSLCTDPSCTNVPAPVCSCKAYDCDVDVGNLLFVLFAVQASPIPSLRFET